MNVQLETGLVTAGRVYDAGEVVDLPPDEAKRFIERGMATPVAEPETPVVETAALNTQPHKGRKDVRHATTRAKP